MERSPIGTRTALSEIEAPAHQPVMLDQILETLQPQPGQLAVDATLGGGGVTAALLERVLPGGRVLAIDRDPSAVEAAQLRFSHRGKAFSAVCAPFSRLNEVTGEGTADLVVMDLGISSIQLDNPARGFSFQADGPLDMRLDPSAQSLTAADIVANYSEEELANLIFRFGEERHSRPIARAIVSRRRVQPISTTAQLAGICAGAIPRHRWPRRLHPATKTFLALRIAVNDELEELRRGIEASVQILRPGGRLGIVFFHSLEGTIAKHSLNVLATDCTCHPQSPVCTCAHRATLSLINRHAIKPSEAEIRSNPRARSAQLRAAIRLSG